MASARASNHAHQRPGPPARLRPLALACLLLGAAPAAYADCTANNGAEFTNCVNTNPSGTPLFLNGNASVAGNVNAPADNINLIATNANLSLTSGAFTVGDGSTFTASGNATVSTSGGLQLGATANLYANSGSTLTLSGATVSTWRPSSAVQIGDATHTGTVNIAANITGDIGLTLNGGTAVLSGTNSYSGDTIINAGTLQISSPANIPPEGPGTGHGGGGTVAPGGGGLAGIIAMFGGKLLATENLTLSNSAVYIGNGSAAPSAAFAAAAGKTFTITGTFALFSTGSLIFGDAANTGTVVLSSSAFSFAAGGNVTIAGGTLTGTNMGTVTHLGASTTVDSGATLDFASAPAASTISKLLGAGTVQTGGSATTLTLGNGSNFSGTIQGAGNLKTDSAATVTFTGANTYTGTTSIISGSTLQLSGNGAVGAGDVTVDGTLAIDRATDTTLANLLSGSGTFNKAGAGKLTLSGGSTFSGTTNLNAGTLAVNGSLAGTLNVNSGAMLNGTGTVGNVNVLAGATLAPGNSVGTLAVNGNLAFNNSSTYRVETDPLANTADQTRVSGNLTIAGALDVQAGAGNYARNTAYTILTNGGTQSGSFSTITSNLAFLTPSVIYSANSVLLVLTRNDISYSGVGGSRNQIAMGQYLDRYGSNYSSGLAGLVNQIDNLSANGARTAFDGLSGSQYSSASQVAQGMGNTFGQGLNGHISGGAAGGAGGAPGGNASLFNNGSMPWGLAVDAPMQMAGMFSGAGASGSAGPANTAGGARETGAAASGDGTTASGYGGSLWRLNPNAAGGLWGQALGGGGRVASDGNGPGSTYRGGGFLAGADFALTPNWLVGVAGGYQRANWDANTNGNATANGKVETPMGAVYARYTRGALMLSATGSYADNKFTTSRNVVIGTTTFTPSSTHKGGEWGGSVQAELAMAAGAWEVRPLVGLRYARLKEDAFSESGGGVTNLSVDARTSSNTTLSAGVKGLYRFGSTGNEGAFELRAIASHLYGDNDTPVSARLAGQSASFTSNGTPLKRDAVTIGAGVSKRIGKRLSGFADVSYEDRGSGQNAYALTAGLRYSW